MKSWIIACLVNITIVIAAQAADDQTDAHMREALNLSSKQLPMKMPGYATLISVSLEPEHIVTYKYIIDLDTLLSDTAALGNMSRQKLLENLQSRLGPDWAKAYLEQNIFPAKSQCAPGIMLTAMKIGYKMNHVVTDVNGKLVFSKNFTIASCNI